MDGNLGCHQRFEPPLGKTEMEVEKIERPTEPGQMRGMEMNPAGLDPTGFVGAATAKLNGRIEKIHAAAGRLKDALPVESVYHNLRQAGAGTAPELTPKAKNPDNFCRRAGRDGRTAGGLVSKHLDLSNP